MNTDMSQFQDTIREWVKVDSIIREINSQGRELREERTNLEDKITTFAERNKLEDTTIRINDGDTPGTLRFAHQKSIQPLTMKFVHACLKDIITDEESVDTIMSHIKASRSEKFSLNIKRSFEGRPNTPV